jgi:gliding motility-associated-like protein
MKQFYKEFSILIHYFLLSILIASLLAPKEVRASHIMGSDVQITCIGEDSFQVELSVFRDCQSPVALPPYLEVNYSSSSTQCGGMMNVYRKSSEDITPVTCQQCTRCDPGCNSFSYGIEMHTYVGLLDFSNYGCCEYTLSFEACCRNNAIDNIQDPGNSSYYMKAFFNRCVADGCLNTPEFSMPPIALICNETRFIYNQGAVSSSGDSLVFSMTDPLEQGGNPVSWKENYNAKEPLDYKGKSQYGSDASFPMGFHLNSSNGDMMFTPDGEMDGIMSVLVEQWRKDTLVSEVRRDIQFAVIECPDNFAPVMSVDNEHIACAGEPITIPVSVSDPDSFPPDPDSVFLNWNKTIPQAQFDKDSGEVYAQSIFKWTPGKEHVRSEPWRFVAMARDNACPVPAFVSQSISVKVNPTPEAEMIINVLDCGEVHLKADVQFDKGVDLKWEARGEVISDKEEFYHNFSRPGKIPVKLTVGKDECYNTYHDTIVVPEFVVVDAGENQIICEGNDVRLEAQTEFKHNNVDFKWNTGDVTPDIQFKLFSDSVFTVTAVDDQGCESVDSVKIKVNAIPHPSIRNEVLLCEGTRARIHTGFPDTYLHEWIDLDNNTTIGDEAGIYVQEPGTFVVHITDTSFAQCKATDTIEVEVIPGLEINVDPPVICPGEKSRLSTQSGKLLSWFDENDSLLKKGEYVDVYPDQTTIFRVMTHSGEQGVYCEDTIMVEVWETPTLKLPEPDTICAKIEVYIPGSVNPDGGEWSGFGMEDNIFYPQETGPGLFYLQYDYTDDQGCTLTDSVSLKVLELPRIELEESVVLCSTDEAFIPKAKPEGGIWEGPYIKTYNNFYWFDAAEAGPGQFEITYKFEDEYECAKSESMTIHVFEKPEVSAGEYGPYCQEHGTVQLQGYPFGENGVWHGPGVHEFSFDPSVAGPGEHNLTFAYVYADGACVHQDQTTINVLPPPETKASLANENNQVCLTMGPVDLYGEPGGEGGSWEGPGVSDDQFYPEVAGKGIHNLIYTYINNEGCRGTDTLKVQVVPPPEIELFSVEENICENETLELKAEYRHASGIVWNSTGDGVIENPYSPSTRYVPGEGDISAGMVTINVSTLTSEGEACPVEAIEKNISITPLPEAAFVTDKVSGCTPLNVSFVNLSIVKYEDTDIKEYIWDFGDGNISELSEPEHQFTDPGDFSVNLQVVDGEGCLSKPFEQQINVYPTPVAGFYAKQHTATLAIPKVDFVNITNEFDVETRYEWQFGDGNTDFEIQSHATNPSHAFIDTGHFTITLTAVNIFECKDRYTRENYIHVKPEVVIYAPNIFSPEGIGPDQNRVFQPVIRGATESRLRIYTRWGKLIYETTDMQGYWDGRFNGQIMPGDVYLYSILTTDAKGDTYRVSGTVTLIR